MNKNNNQNRNEDKNKKNNENKNGNENKNHNNKDNDNNDDKTRIIIKIARSRKIRRIQGAISSAAIAPRLWRAAAAATEAVLARRQR